jgi:rhodanese-related sulfurtransferase
MEDGLVIEPQAVKEMIERGEEFLLLDCREPWEHETAKIEGATLIPMRRIPSQADQFPKNQPVVVFCHSGVRSLNVASWLKGQGVRARSLSGGIDRWSVEIDPGVPRY